MLRANTRACIIALAFMLCVSSLVLFAEPGHARGSSSSILRVGRVTENPKKQFRAMRPYLHYLVGQLGEQGVHGFEIVFSRTLDEMLVLAANGQVDVISETAYSASQLIAKGGMEPMAREWRNGVSEYCTLFLVRKDSAVRRLEDLKGKVVAFEDAGSTSGYYVPGRELVKAGLQLQELPLASEPYKAPDDKVGYVFTLSEKSMLPLVLENSVTASVLADKDWRKGSVATPEQKSAVRILHSSPKYPRAVFLVRKTMAAERKDAIKAVLLAGEHAEDGRAAFRSFKNTTRYDMLSSEDAQLLRSMGSLQ